MRYNKRKKLDNFHSVGPDREQLRRASEQLLCTSLYASMSACSALSDLEAERAKASFPIAELTHVLDGDAQLTALNARLSKIASSDAVLSSWKRDEQRGVPRTSTLRHAEVMHRLHRCAQLAEKHDLDAMESLQLKLLAGGAGIFLHDVVFVPCIAGLASADQVAEWLPAAISYEWIGCYAQTELLHGSNVAGLQTTAHYLGPVLDAFELHTPNPGATKWWPGALGALATHAIVFARLVLPGEEGKGTDMGIHPFLVQLRSLIDHAPLRGITVGGVGRKWGTNDVDNGYCSFDRVRLPRGALLAKHASIDREGAYTRTAPKSSSYSTMTFVRAQIVAGSSKALGCAATIAVRYAAQRRQQPAAAPGARECAVLEYTSVQARLLPLVATACALRFVGRHMLRLHSSGASSSNSVEERASKLKAVHIASCALKSLCTTLAADGIEECRRSCGGNGFLMASGLPQIYTDFMPSFTAEGDNWLLTQQAARALVKRGLAFEQQRERSRSGAQTVEARAFAETLAERFVSGVDDPTSARTLVRAFRQRAASFIAEALVVVRAENLSAASVSPTATPLLHAHQPLMYKLSRAHGAAVVVEAFAAVVARPTLSPALAAVLRRLLATFALQQIEKHLGEFLVAGFFAVEDAPALRESLSECLRLLRPDAVSIVDAFAHSDFELNSALGAYDGRYAERLLETATPQQGPPMGYAEYLRPIISGHVAKL